MVILGAFLLGMIIGAVIYAWRIKSKTLGSIKMIRSDPDDPPYLFLESKVSPDDIMSHDIVMFEVSHK